MSNDFDIPSKQIAKPMNKKSSSVPVTADAAPESVEKVENAKTDAVGPKYDPDELLRIFDEIIFTGGYVEEVIVRKRVPVKFSTRTAEQIDAIQGVLDSAGLTLISTVEQKRSILGLEQALVSFNGKDLSGMKPKERSEFVGRLAAPVIGMLLTALNEFDNKVAAACREEANF